MSGDQNKVIEKNQIPITMSKFRLSETGKLDGDLGIDINDDIQKLLIGGEGDDSLSNKLKNDGILKDIFKSGDTISEALEEIKALSKNFSSGDETIEDIMGYLYRVRNFIKKNNNNDSKIFDDYIKTFEEKLNKMIEEKINNDIVTKNNDIVKSILMGI